MIHSAPNDPARNDPADDGLPALTPRLLYRDGLLLVIDKPPGLPVHPGPKAQGRTIPTLTDYLDGFRFGLPRRPEAAHRLDKDTSGCLVLGRHPRALARLNEQFAKGEIGKRYWAVVDGAPADDSGTIDLPLGRRDPNRGWWMAVVEGGQPATTRWQVLGRGESEGRPLAWLELTPLTGRTHQLRVHCAAAGWPIHGDPIYGTGPRNGPPWLHLHARSVRIPLKAGKPPLEVEAPPPSHMHEMLARCGWSAMTHPTRLTPQSCPTP